MSRQREPLPTRVEELSPLSPAYGAALEPALARLRLDLDATARGLIGDHVRFLLAWNEAINLTAIREPAAIATRHVADSLAAAPVLRAAGIDALVDLGSGGGFPGLPLAIAVPLERTLLVESVAKKARFLETAVAGIGLAGRVAVIAERAETLARDADHRERWPAVTARAVAGLGELVELAFPLLRPSGLLLCWKAVGLEAELSGARRAMAALGGGELTIHEVPLPELPGDRLVVIAKRGPTSLSFPRDPQVRSRRPW